MFIYFITFFIISILILTNAVTDAPNAIATLVGTKVMKFRKAAFLSAVSNFIGVILMSFINISVADCISGIIKIDSSKESIFVLMSSMLSVIIFALIALKFGIPTSETHGLVAGLTGSAIAIYGIKGVNLNEWINVIIGLFWSVLGSLVIAFILNKVLKRKLNSIKEKDVEKIQIVGCMGMSFMHGAQDGQKFIGILIIFLSIVSKVPILNTINPMDYIWIILFVSILMFLGVSWGGKSIVENIGSNMAKIDKRQALLTDISTATTLLIASLTGLPVSTTHVKTISIIGVSKYNKVKLEKKTVTDIIKAWILTFPICALIGVILTKILMILFI